MAIPTASVAVVASDCSGIVYSSGSRQQLTPQRLLLVEVPLLQTHSAYAFATAWIAASATLATATSRRRRTGRDRQWTPCRGYNGGGEKLQEGTRGGVRINKQYKASRSYGSVDDEDMEEGARVRAMYSGEISSQAQSSSDKLAAARKRLLKRRLTKGQGWQAPMPAQEPPQRLRRSSASSNEGRDSQPEMSLGGEDEEREQAKDDDDVAPQSSEAEEDIGRDGDATAIETDVVAAPPIGVPFPGLADTVMSSTRRRLVSLTDAASVPLDTAERLAGDESALQRCAAPRLAAAASTLSKAGKHALAAVLYRHVRDFGVERGVLMRELTLEQAAELFEEASLQFGLELQLAGELAESWAALLALCAEERKSSDPRKAVSALADVTMQLLWREKNPTKQVEFLRGAVDAATLKRVLPRDRQDELELTLALSLQAAGEIEESRQMLQTLERGAASERRRQQAQWALAVQNVDVGDGPAASTLELKAVWANTVQDLGAGSGPGSAAAAFSRNRKGGSGGMPGLQFGSLGILPAVAVALLLALPLGIPLVASLKSGP